MNLITENQTKYFAFGLLSNKSGNHVSVIKVNRAKHEASDSSITERRRMHKLKVDRVVIAASRLPFV